MRSGWSPVVRGQVGRRGVSRGFEPGQRDKPIKTGLSLRSNPGHVPGQTETVRKSPKSEVRNEGDGESERA